MNSLATASRLLRHIPTPSIAVRSITTLQETLASQVPSKQAKLAALKKEHGSKVIGKVTIDQLIGGARGVKCMLWETSNLDAEEGIRFRGLTIPECQQVSLLIGGS
jgi:citrate synthase